MKALYFASNQDIDDYVRNSDYGETDDRPYLSFAVAFDSFSQQNYEYELRFNVSGDNPIVNPNDQDPIAKFYPYS